MLCVMIGEAPRSWEEVKICCSCLKIWSLLPTGSFLSAFFFLRCGPWTLESQIWLDKLDLFTNHWVLSVRRFSSCISAPEHWDLKFGWISWIYLRTIGRVEEAVGILFCFYCSSCQEYSFNREKNCGGEIINVFIATTSMHLPAGGNSRTLFKNITNETLPAKCCLVICHSSFGGTLAMYFCNIGW